MEPTEVVLAMFWAKPEPMNVPTFPIAAPAVGYAVRLGLEVVTVNCTMFENTLLPSALTCSECVPTARLGMTPEIMFARGHVLVLAVLVAVKIVTPSTSAADDCGGLREKRVGAKYLNCTVLPEGPLTAVTPTPPKDAAVNTVPAVVEVPVNAVLDTLVPVPVRPWKVELADELPAVVVTVYVPDGSPLPLVEVVANAPVTTKIVEAVILRLRPVGEAVAVQPETQNRVPAVIPLVAKLEENVNDALTELPRVAVGKPAPVTWKPSPTPPAVLSRTVGAMFVPELAVRATPVVTPPAVHKLDPSSTSRLEPTVMVVVPTLLKPSTILSVYVPEGTCPTWTAAARVPYSVVVGEVTPTNERQLPWFRLPPVQLVLRSEAVNVVTEGAKPEPVMVTTEPALSPVDGLATTVPGVNVNVAVGAVLPWKS